MFPAGQTCLVARSLWSANFAAKYRFAAGSAVRNVDCWHGGMDDRAPAMTVPWRVAATTYL
jgi:hypothetical protein